MEMFSWSKIVYDQAHQTGYAKGYLDAKDQVEKEYEERIARLVAEIRELDARISVLSRKI